MLYTLRTVTYVGFHSRWQGGGTVPSGKAEGLGCMLCRPQCSLRHMDHSDAHPAPVDDALEIISCLLGHTFHIIEVTNYYDDY